MSSTQYQHYVPQNYLRGWTDTSDRLTVFEAKAGRLVSKSKSTRSTGGRGGLYHIAMAPPGKENFMEDVFWRAIDQWGADALKLMRSGTTTDAQKLVSDARLKARFSAYLLAFEYRHPNRVAFFKSQAQEHLLGGCLTEDYAAHRRSHEPDTFEEFVTKLDQPGLSEHGAALLRQVVLQESVRKRMLGMAWDVMTIPTAGPRLLTSDVPLVRYKGIDLDDGMLILPVSPHEFFVAYNRGSIPMRAWIMHSMSNGKFVEEINRCVIDRRVEYVYAADDSQRDFIARHFEVCRTPAAAD